MEILYVLLVVLIATRALGEAAVRPGQPALVGELLAIAARVGLFFAIAVPAGLLLFPKLARFVSSLHGDEFESASWCWRSWAMQCSPRPSRCTS